VRSTPRCGSTVRSKMARRSVRRSRGPKEVWGCCGCRSAAVRRGRVNAH
jgi:hypothetical protein